MANHVGVFKHQSEILNMIYAKNGFVGVVSDILDGYNYEVTRKDTGQTIKL